MAEQQSSGTMMVRYECRECSMSATCVDTDAARDAWRRHMTEHRDPTSFDAWAWEVLRLDL